MTYARIGLLALLTIGTLEPALAATPKLSGAYIYSGTMSCQARITWTTGNAVRSVTSGPVLTGSTSGFSGVDSLVTGPVLTAQSYGNAVTSVEPYQTGQFVVDVTTGFGVVDIVRAEVVTATTTGTGVKSASSGAVVLTHSIIDNDATVHEAIGTMTFNASTHKVNVKQTSVAGTLLRKGNGTSSDADALKKKTTTTNNQTYANTAGTLTINGTAHTVVYGNIVSGVARHVNYLRLDANGCAFRGTLVQQ